MIASRFGVSRWWTPCSRDTTVSRRSSVTTASVPSSLMQPTEEFTRLVRRPDREIPLDEAALLISAHDHDVDIAATLASLDELSRDAPDEPEAMAEFLFADGRFAGNEIDYADPRNSFLDEVLRRRLGIPITLSVLMIEVSRRRGHTLQGIGMPGHFLVGAGPDRFIDPFHGGATLDRAACRTLFERGQIGAPWTDSYLTPVGPRAILVRMLANLVHTLVERAPADAVWALRLRLAVPGVAAGERRDAAALLGTLGRFEEAATVLDALAGELDAPGAARARQDAARLRARAN
jgi:regulator of sirC expression with transglutaminase-like and TPR domain